jgi:hypothetical protein
MPYLVTTRTRRKLDTRMTTAAFWSCRLTVNTGAGCYLWFSNATNPKPTCAPTSGQTDSRRRRRTLGGLYGRGLAKAGLRSIPMGNDMQNGSPRLWCGMLDDGDSLDCCIRP